MRALFLLLLSFPAFAVDLTCTYPTQNEDGSPLTDLAGIRFYESLVSGGPYTLIADVVPCAYSFDRPAGTYYYVATAYNTADIESVYSGEATKIVGGAPNPPSNLVASGDLLAYGLQQSEGVVVVFPVGTIPDATPCDPSMSVNGKYKVPKSSVGWIGSVRPAIVFADCVGE